MRASRNNLNGAHHFNDLVVDEDAKEPEPLTDATIKRAARREYVYPQDELMSLRAEYGFSDVTTPAT